MRTFNNLPSVPDRKHIVDFRQLLKSNSDTYGDKVLYGYKENGEMKTMSYTEFYKAVISFSTALKLYNLDGKTIAVTGDTHPYWMVAFYSIIIMGGIVVPLDHDLDGDQVADFMKISKCSAIVYTSSMNSKINDINDKIDFIEYQIPLDANKTNDKIIPFCDLLLKGNENYEKGNTVFFDIEIDLNKVAAILFTSGTTGSSKGVMLSQGNLVTSGNACCLSTQYGPDDVFVSVLPIHHTYELTTGQIALPNLGCTAYICESIRYATKYFKEYRPTALILVPLFLETIHKKIWQEIEKKGMTKKVRAAMKVSDAMLAVGIDKRDKFFKDITSVFGGRLKSVIVGGAPIDPQIIKDFYSFGITVLQGYGITECSPLVAVNRPGNVKFNSVGPTVEYCEAKILPIVDSTDENEGEIIVRGGNVMLGYYENADATKEVFTDDGWFKTGDIGTIDKDGFIRITGRLKNVIIASNGKNVFPEELEERINRISAVKESVVISRNTDNGSEIVAVIVPDYDVLGEGTSDAAASFILKEAIAQINKSLPAYKHIDRFEIRHSDFEKTLTKKIKRFLVK